jgi:hypothetical protein
MIEGVVVDDDGNGSDLISEGRAMRPFRPFSEAIIDKDDVEGSALKPVRGHRLPWSQT